jgi:hypothetical protein
VLRKSPMNEFLILFLYVINHGFKVTIAPALCHFDHALCGIAQGQVQRYARIARHHTFSFISRRIRNKIRKYFRALIRGLYGIVWWKKRRSKISWHCPFNKNLQLKPCRNSRVKNMENCQYTGRVGTNLPCRLHPGFPFYQYFLPDSVGHQQRKLCKKNRVS